MNEKINKMEEVLDACIDAIEDLTKKHNELVDIVHSMDRYSRERSAANTLLLSSLGSFTENDVKDALKRVGEIRSRLDEERS